MAGLGVNIDHVATVREARRTIEPDPLWAAVVEKHAAMQIYRYGALELDASDN